jgi:ribosomal protein S18 acetylase RimI-like enzyme
MDERYTRSIRGLLEVWRHIARRTPGGETRDSDGVTVASLASGSAGNNRAFLVDPADDPIVAVDSAVAFYGDRSRPFTLEVREELPPDHLDAAMAAGLKEIDRAPMMVLAPIDADALRSQVAGYEIKEALTPGEITAVADAAVLGFGGEGNRVYATPELAGDGCSYFVAYAGDRPVASSFAFVHEGTAGIYLVSTAPDHRRRGLGEALTAIAVARGLADGCDMSFLQASEEGYGVYERMGFRTVGLNVTYR